MTVCSIQTRLLIALIDVKESPVDSRLELFFKQTAA